MSSRSALRFAIAVALLSAASEMNADETAFRDHVAPFITAHCADCHAIEEPEAQLSLGSWSSAEQAIADRQTWMRVRRALARKEMPPADQEQPPPAERRRVIDWIDRAVLGVDCNHPDPGRITVRRLNRAEYRNTIRDLLDVEAPEVADFPVDASGHGFDNLGDALTVSPLLAEKLLAAAETAAERAILAPEDMQPKKRRYALDLLEIGYNARQQGNGWVALTSTEEDDLAIELWAPAGGEYVLRASAYGEPRSSRPMELSFLIGDQAQHTLKIDAGPPRVYEAKMKARRGEQRFRVAVRRIKDGLSEEEAAIWKKGPTQNGAVFVEWIEIEGPLSIASSEPTPFQERLLAPAKDTQKASDALAPFLERAFRRPPTSDEVARLAKIAASAQERGASFEASLRLAVTAALVSPAFLFRIEPPTGAGDAMSEPIDEFALASRLSYFLWSSMPDDELFALARAGELRKQLSHEVARMLADEKSSALVENFAGQWLELRNLELAAPDRALFPEFDEPLRQAMRRETELFFANLIAEDRPLPELLTADYTFVNERLAKHYGLEGVKGDEFRRVSLAETRRTGLLTHASILTLSSNPNRTSPVKRGKWVLENLLNAPPPAPPPDVPALEKTEQEAGLPLRQRLEAHRAGPTCASCHRRMDDIGFALEHFDAVGARRETDNGATIDATGELSPGLAFDGAEELAKLLGEAEQEAFVRCVAEKLLTYALGRGLEYYDVCAVDSIVEACRAGDYRFSSLVQASVASVPFQKQRVESPGR
jgi:hypothetical protein